MLDKKVKEIMTTDVITTTSDIDVVYAFEKLMEHKISALPVVDGDKLIGIITATDVGHNLILDKYELGTNVEEIMIKYIDKEKGEIDIRLLDEVDSIRVEIEDNGKGIEAKDLPNIFERFYRTDASRNSSKGGSGIGLSIVKKIIEDHGGYIWATSKMGEGTCMHFVIRKYKDMKEEAYE